MRHGDTRGQTVRVGQGVRLTCADTPCRKQDTITQLWQGRGTDLQGLPHKRCGFANLVLNVHFACLPNMWRRKQE